MVSQLSLKQLYGGSTPPPRFHLFDDKRHTVVVLYWFRSLAVNQAMSVQVRSITLEEDFRLQVSDFRKTED